MWHRSRLGLSQSQMPETSAAVWIVLKLCMAGAESQGMPGCPEGTKGRSGLTTPGGTQGRSSLTTPGGHRGGQG